MIQIETLYEMSQMDIDEIDTSILVDISTIIINENASQLEKIDSIIRQMGNPYCFLSDNHPVRVRFANEKNTLSNSLIHYFTQLKQQ